MSWTDALLAFCIVDLFAMIVAYLFCIYKMCTWGDDQ